MIKVFWGALICSSLFACSEKTKIEEINYQDREPINLTVETSYFALSSAEFWPNHYPDMSDKTRGDVVKYQQEFKEKGYSPEYRQAYPYNSHGTYFSYGVHGASCQQNEVEGKKKLNKDGVMMLKTNDGFMSTPVLSAQCGIQSYFYHRRNLNEEVLAYVKDLLNAQNQFGGFEYLYHLKYKSVDLAPGWTSGMAQGQALSFFARILQDHELEGLHNAGEWALNYMITPIEEGGVMSTLADLHPSLSNYIMFEEIVSDTEAQPHILNGNLFSLIGLYDWWQLEPDAQAGSHHIAKLYFEQGVKTLEKLLPYYDELGMSSYDIWHLTDEKQSVHLAPAHYHYVHIYLLEAIYSITDSPIIGHYMRRWSLDVGYIRDYKTS
ncbi:MAG: hypothetical protein HWE10_14395 [Gammaproteobacteria bacterium]|nr:hypothetical protein [Gammaproteobacteria bacterium]